MFLQILKLCRKAGLVKLGHVALDGTRIKANASRHKAMRYKRMKEEEARLEKEIAELLQNAEVTDKEDHRYGKNKRGDELPQELTFRESRLKKIREAKEALEAEARQYAAKNEKKDDQDGQPKGKYFIQAYNAQAAVDRAHQIFEMADVEKVVEEANYFVTQIRQAISQKGKRVFPRLHHQHRRIL